MIKLFRMVRSRIQKNSFFCPFASLYANGVRGSHAVRYCLILIASYMVLYYDLFHNFSVLTTETKLHWWRMHVFQYV